MTKQRIYTLPVGQLQANSYIVETGQQHAVVIDPGDDGEYIIDNLLRNELTPIAIFATHGHFDHIMAGFTLQAAYNIPFYLHKKDSFLVERMRETALHFHETDPGPAPIVTYFDDKTLLQIPNIEIEIVKTPGHTPGSVSYLINKTSLFVGDLCFADGSVGEVTHSYSSREDLKKSLEKISQLTGDITVYPGHGGSWALL